MTLAGFFRRLRYLLRRDRALSELGEEMRLHLELRARTIEQTGVPPHEARLAARRQFGNATVIAERSRDAWGLERLDHLGQDLRYALRRVRTRPGFSAAVIAVLALGIGATTAVFSAVDAALFRPLPFERPHELVTLTNVSIPFQDETDERFPVTIQDIARMPHLFPRVAGFAAGGLNLSDPDGPEHVGFGVVTTGFFETLGVQPHRGRTFSAEEGQPGGSHVAVLSHRLWQRRFGGRDMTGAVVPLNGKPYTIIGVMPAGFGFPRESELWIPLTVPTTRETFEPFRGYLPARVVARLAPGVNESAAAMQLIPFWQQRATEPGAGGRDWVDATMLEVRSRPTRSLQEELAGSRRTPLVVLLGATGLLLLIACANVANLLLSDGTRRRREIALREVLGASRGRIVRQLLAESVLLALAGTALGLALAPAGLGVLRAMLPEDLAGVAPASLDLRVLGFAATLAVVTALAFGLWPALRATGEDATSTIKSGGGHGATAGRLGVARRGLVVAELALTVMLLVEAGLMLRSLHRVMSQDLGMTPEQVATLELSFPSAEDARAERLRVVNEVLDRLREEPGIEAAGAVNDLPLRGSPGLGLLVSADASPKREEMHYARYLVASGGYFQSMGIQLQRGRTFSVADDATAPRVVIVSRTMADKLWPGADGIGRTLGVMGDSLPLTVVGIVADVREEGLDREKGGQVYFSIGARPPHNAAIVARGTLSTGAILATLRAAVLAADPAQPVFNVRMMEDVVGVSVAPRRTNTLLISIFAGLALLLSALGVYAVVAYGVSRRARELGIRAALGATGAGLVRFVAGEMAVVVALGTALGLGGVWAAARLLESLVYGVGVRDPATFVAVPIAVIVPAALATLIPAWRATRVNPADVIRTD